MGYNHHKAHMQRLADKGRKRMQLTVHADLHDILRDAAARMTAVHTAMTEAQAPVPRDLLNVLAEIAALKAERAALAVRSDLTSSQRELMGEDCALLLRAAAVKRDELLRKYFPRKG